MNKYIPLLAAVTFGSIIVACSEQDSSNNTKIEPMKETVIESLPLSYPNTNKGPVVDTYFEVEVEDPYRWLEDDRSVETASWVTAQNKVTFDYLDNIPYRDKLKQSLTDIWDYEKVGSPFIEGNYTYFYKNDGLQNQYVIYRYKTIGQTQTDATVFLDPNKFSEDGTTSLGQISFSKDGSVAAYAISEGGSDWRKIIVIDIESKEALEPVLVDVKFSGISWFKNEGFYYSSYDKPEGSELSAKTDQHKLYYHKLGTPQSNDIVIFGETAEQKRRYVGGTVTDDNRYLLISGSVSTSGNDLYIKDLSKSDSPLVTILDHTDSDTYLLDNDGDKLFLVTNLDADNKKLVSVDAKAPTATNWVDVIPETENVLSASKGAGFLFARYMVDAISKVYQYDYNGEQIREIILPGAGTASSLSGKKTATTLYYSFTNSTTPSSIFTFDALTGKTALYYKSKVKFNSNEYE